MATGTSTAGEQLIHIPPGNVKAMVPVTGYTPIYGHLTFDDATVNNSVDRAANDEAPSGIIISINNSNGIVSVARFKSGTRVILPYTGTATVGHTILAAGTRQAANDRDDCKTHATNGVGKCVAVNVPATNFLVAEF